MVADKETYLSILAEIPDPEVPVLTISDLGILRDVKINGDAVEVIITPTYSGCPAMDMISMQIRMALLEAGFKNVKLTQVLIPCMDYRMDERVRKKKIQRLWNCSTQSKATGLQ